jgi:predicted HicB family RNase H-like nuclease
MMIDGRKTLVFSEQTQIRTQPGMRAALKEAARREGVTLTEFVRRALSASIAATSKSSEARP